MASLLRKSAKTWGVGCCASCEGKNGHRALQHQARQREAREWQAEADAEEHADLWCAYYDDAYRHLAEDSGMDPVEADRMAIDWANEKAGPIPRP